LFWEAATLSTSNPAPVNDDKNNFRPAHAIVDATNSIVLPFTDFISYLNSTLKSLTLHTSARNDFITYWLPHFVKINERGQLIAFRLLPQIAYEKSARLNVTPRPDVVTRVFMLFKGVGREEENSFEIKTQDVNWRNVVGVKDEAMDESLFRVLEWGGMEVV
jgi:hypothetical protein